MKSILSSSLLSLLFFLISIPAANAAGSLLRVTCSGDDIGAEITINDKYKGECPLDIQMQEGSYKLRVEKNDATYDRDYEQNIRMGDGVVKKIEVVLSKRLNAAGQRQEDERQRQQAAKEQAIINGIEMVSIPGRNFEMGKFEVTQGQWKAVMGSTPSNFKNCGDACPVEMVSWNDVQEFLQKLNAKTGKQYRLPTEAEWQYACYGGSQTEYCGGNDLNTVGWYDKNSGNATHPVGQKQANGYGLYDMSGNVWELMENCDDNSCVGRALRGGSWGHYVGDARAASRGGSRPAYRHNSYGFRVARTLP